MFTLPFILARTPLYTVGHFAVDVEIPFPFTILDIAFLVLQQVFLPVFLTFDMDQTLLEAKCATVQGL